MDAPRIRTGHARGETPPNARADLEWIHQHEQELLDKYGESMILVYQQQVIGAGQTYADMVADAERNLPPHVTEATPITYLLHYRQPFFRVRSG